MNKLIQIHNAIHSQYKDVILEDEILDIIISSNGCRRVDWQGFMIMEQNKNKRSPTANLANVGHKITWGLNSGYVFKIHERPGKEPELEVFNKYTYNTLEL